MVVAIVVMFLTMAQHAIAANFKIAVNLPFDDPTFGTAISGLKKMFRLIEPDLMTIDPVTNHTFSLVYNPTSLSGAVSSSVAIRTMLNDSVVGIVGDYYSSLTIPQAYSTKFFKVWMCSGSATSVTLSSDTDFPFFFRTIGNDYQQGASMAAFIKVMGWNRVNIIASSDFYGQSLSEGLSRQAALLSINVTASVTFTPGSTTFDQQLEVLKATGTAVNFVAATAVDGVQIMRTAKRLGMVGPTWMWLSADTFAAYFDLGGLAPEDYTYANGIMYVMAKESGGNAIAKAFQAKWDAAYPGVRIPAYAYLYRDCAFAMAHGIVGLTQSKGAASVQNRSYDLVLNELMRDFEGASGVFRVDQFGDRIADFSIYNMVNGKYVEVATVFANLTVQQTAPYKFYGGSATPPSDKQYQDVLTALWTMPSGLGLGITGIVLIGYIVATGAYLFAHRKVSFVKHLSARFLSLIGLGCIIVLVSSLVAMGEQTAGSCMASTWLFAIGYELVVGASIAKTYRIWVIFENRSQIKATGIQDSFLFIIMGAIMAGQIIILIVWSAVDPPLPHLISTRSYLYTICSSSTTSFTNSLVAASMVYNGFFLIIFLYLAVATRNVTSSYNESKWILYTVQNILLSSVVVAPFAIFDFGASALSAFIVKHSIIYSAVTFTFVALVGRLIFDVRKSTIKKSKTKHVGSKSDTDKGGSASAMKPAAGASPAWSAKGICQVKASGFFSQWITMRLQLFNTEGTLVMMPATGGQALGVVLDVGVGMFHPSPRGHTNTVEIIAQNKSWLVKFNDEKDYKRWKDVLGAVSNPASSTISGSGANTAAGMPKSPTQNNLKPPMSAEGLPRAPSSSSGAQSSTPTA
ncbi:hypothetical protein H9P43_001067 [Blastocladiella emersonii ATCC 22665]|nr:hypothetical protein H9P43_001067 [Blastocladiella emersonii ATCC 22665]